MKLKKPTLPTLPQELQKQIVCFGIESYIVLFGTQRCDAFCLSTGNKKPISPITFRRNMKTLIKLSKISFRRSTGTSFDKVKTFNKENVDISSIIHTYFHCGREFHNCWSIPSTPS